MVRQEFYIFVYGSLRKGLYNNDYFLKHEEPCEVLLLGGYQMYDLGSYPFITEGEDNDSIIVESYRVDAQTYAQIKMMEEGAGYETQYIPYEGDFASIWIFPGWKDCKYPRVKDGDYTKYVAEKVGGLE